MKFLSTLAIFGALFASSANADILYDNNGAATGSIYGQDISSSIVTNSFTLTSDSILTRLNFDTWSVETGAQPKLMPTQVTWEISNTALQDASTAIATGIANITATYVGQDQAGYGYAIFSDSIVLPNISLGAGSYWIQLSSAIDGAQGQNQIAWDEVDGKSKAYISNLPSPTPIGSEGFQIIGTVSAVPLPAAVWLFGGVLMGWLGICKYRPQAKT